MQWYYAENGQQVGPVDDATLATLVEQGRIAAETLVWNANMANWQSYGEVAGGGGDAVGAAAAAGDGGPVAVGTMACVECGRRLAPEEMVHYGSSYVCPECKPLFFQKIREGVNVGTEMRYAGFWIRFGAVFIDGLIFWVILIPLNMLFATPVVMPSGTEGNPFMAMMMQMSVRGSLIGILSMAIGIGYHVYFHGRFGATLGKMACGLRVVKPDGSKITYLNAFGRHCMSDLILMIPFLGWLIWLVGHVMAGVDDEKRALHDRVAATRVIHVKR